ncbi:MAG: sigma-54-dependent Fis family transcriptional regulator [Candidatus Marinimicrobia bacterium]|nr:sigma-54-dependent Fis family transcriptional regulator [Candidatus Neomarinimicrobiota bacterium]
MNQIGPRILIIDDEQDFLDATANLLRRLNYEPMITRDAEYALELVESQNYDLVLCDLQMPDLDGLEMLRRIHLYAKDLPVVIVSAYGTIDRAVACMKAGAFEFIEKPFEVDHLKVVIERALQFTNLVEERQHLLQQLKAKYKFENIISKSDVMLQIFKLIETIAPTDVNILITGESGTGKELIARSIHARSKRQAKPFVPMNCGALPENLFESELFGYEKGAFTGADQSKIGLFEYANKGTFFLDEVCEMNQSVQTKFLRVLQERELRRLGGHVQIPINVRIISATNRSPENILDDDSLRADLYYRLNVVHIHIPPLRDRKGDIQLLAAHFLKKSMVTTNKKKLQFAAETISMLESYNWPGNVRELENVVERAVALCNDVIIQPTDLPGQLQKLEPSHERFDSMSFKQVRNKVIEKVEKRYLVFLLRKHMGNITRVAEEAEMTRRNTYRLLQKHSINPEDWRDL